MADPTRMAALEETAREVLFQQQPLPTETRAALLPRLGNVAEAVIETMLVEDHGWHPVYDDVSAYSSGHGVDLILLDSALERLVAVEVKSTIQSTRWPRLARGAQEQLTPAWFDRPDNEGMVEWELRSADVVVMVAQVHLLRRQWRACLASKAGKVQPVDDLHSLGDLAWLDNT